MIWLKIRHLGLITAFGPLNMICINKTLKGTYGSHEVLFNAIIVRMGQERNHKKNFVLCHPLAERTLLPILARRVSPLI